MCVCININCCSFAVDVRVYTFLYVWGVYVYVCVCVFLWFDRQRKILRLSVLVIIGYISIVKCNWISVWIYTLIIVIDATIIVCIVSSWSTRRVCVFVCIKRNGERARVRKKRDTKILHKWQQETYKCMIVWIVQANHIRDLCCPEWVFFEQQ